MHMHKHFRKVRQLLYVTGSAAVFALAPSQAIAQDEAIEEVVVSGFRQSLEAALNNKRDAVNSIESVVAEDIGKMPDLNLAESLQRVPGVAITRQGGEGRQISLRGLGPEFTHVTLNGMEVPAATNGLDSVGGINRGRNFDFNVFSADLFNRIDIIKSPTAAVEEGGLAGAVELYTMRPLDNPGLTLSVSGKLGHNDLSEETDPRVTAVFSNTNADETFGYMFSFAYTERTAFQDGFGTVRWAKTDATATSAANGFAAENTTDYVLAPRNGTPNNLNDFYYPRLPRQDSFRHFQERTGISGAIQFRPTDQIEFGLNYVTSKFEAETQSYNSFGQFRRNLGQGYNIITVNDITLAADGETVLAGDFNGVTLRTESRQNDDVSEFEQITADFKYDISDDLSLSAMIGKATADLTDDLFRANIESNVANNGFSYDFTRDPNVAAIQYDFDVTNPANFFIQNNELIRINTVDRTNDTARVDLSWALSDESTVKAGLMINDREVDSTESTLNVGPPADLASISYVFSYEDIGGHGSATELDFLVLDFARARAAYGIGTLPYVLDTNVGGATWNVQEETTAVYLDYTLDTDLGGRGLRFNAGVRSVSTDVTAAGYLLNSSGVPTLTTGTNDYNNVLPMLNIAYDATEDLVLRFNAGKSLTRPALNDLVPSRGYNNVNFTVTGGRTNLKAMESTDINLAAEWYFAENSVLAFTYFTKDVDSFITRPNREQPLTPEDLAGVAARYPGEPGLLDPSLDWTYSSAENTDGTEMDGYEIAYQQAFTALPGFWSNFGFLANYSHVDATTRITRSGELDTVPLEGLSENSYNWTLYYEVDTFGIRASANSRDDYITANIGSNGNLSEATTGPTQIDLSGFYNINDSISLTLEIVNLTDEKERLYTTGVDGDKNLVREFNKSGTTIFLGARFNL